MDGDTSSGEGDEGDEGEPTAIDELMERDRDRGFVVDYTDEENDANELQQEHADGDGMAVVPHRAAALLEYLELERQLEKSKGAGSVEAKDSADKTVESQRAADEELELQLEKWAKDNADGDECNVDEAEAAEDAVGHDDLDDGADDDINAPTEQEEDEYERQLYKDGWE